MSNPNINKLQELVKISRDGAEFYDAAAGQVINPALQATFRRQAQAKRDLVNALSGRLEMIGAEIPDSGTILGSLHKVYAEIKATLSSADEKVYVAELEAAEDRLLEHFNDAIRDCDNTELVSQLNAHLPNVRASHDEMRSLKHKMAA